MESNLYTALFVLLFAAIPTLFALKYNDKLYYFYSKSTGSGPKVLSFFFLFLMMIIYFFAFAAFLFRSIFPLGYMPLIILLLSTLSLPGIYLASKKNFLIFFNKKMNTFLIRLFFLIPGAFTFNACITFFLSVVVLMFSPYLDEFNEIGIGVLLTLSIIGSLLTIFYFKRCILKDDLPPEYQIDFMEHELYIFMPIGKRINDQASYNNSIGIRMQARDLQVNSKKSIFDFLFFRFYSPQFLETTLNYKILNDNDILFTRHGALIVSNKALEIFEKSNLTGYQIRSILDRKTKNNLLTHFQLVSTSKMPQMSSQTRIKKGLFGALLIPNDKIYYNSSVLNRVSDFNKTSEYLGANLGLPYFHQKFWIVSNKTMRIMINDLNQHKRDFIPVILVDGKGE
jgi:hypothetical protein